MFFISTFFFLVSWHIIFSLTQILLHFLVASVTHHHVENGFPERVQRNKMYKPFIHVISWYSLSVIRTPPTTDEFIKFTIYWWLYYFKIQIYFIFVYTHTTHTSISLVNVICKIERKTENDLWLILNDLCLCYYEKLNLKFTCLEAIYSYLYHFSCVCVSFYFVSHSKWNEIMNNIIHC